MESEKVKDKIRKLIDCDKKQNEFGGIFVVNRQFLIEALTLINELESENAELTKAVVDNLDAYRDGFNEGASLKDRVDNKLKNENKQLKDRIAELEKENKILRKHNIGYHVANNYEAQEQLKEFVERLKEKVKNFCGTEYENAYYDVTKSFACNDIDETLKEFIGNYGD